MISGIWLNDSKVEGQGNGYTSTYLMIRGMKLCCDKYKSWISYLAQVFSDLYDNFRFYWKSHEFKTELHIFSVPLPVGNWLC